VEATLPYVKVSATIVETVLEARRRGLNKKECARAAGVHRDTLDDWLRLSKRGDFSVHGHERFHVEFDDAMAAYRLAQIRERFPLGAATA
jgi:transposase-like protein